MSQSVKHFYLFGPFRLDPDERILLRDSERVPLTPKVFDTLIILIKNAGHVVSKDELMNAVWPDTFVDEGTMTRTVSRLRQTLGDGNEENKYIETIPRIGYRFVAEIRESPIFIDELATEIGTQPKGKDPLNYIPAAPVAKDQRKRQIGFILTALAVSVLGLSFYLWIATHSRADGAEPGRIEANQAYQQGRALWNKRTAAALFQSIEFFDKAIEKDPTFALGYDGLADAYAFDLVHWKQSEALAKKSLSLDNKLAEPHATLGFIHTFWEWNWKGAEQEFREAIKLNPGYATAHQWFAMFLAVNGRKVESVMEMKRAVELDPQSPVMNADMCLVNYFFGEYDAGIRYCQKALDIDKDFFNAHQYLYLIYLQRQMYDKAVDEFITANSLPGVASQDVPVDRLRDAYQAKGINGFWQVRLQHLTELIGAEWEIAECYAYLGDKEQALDWLQKAVDQHRFNAVFLFASPVFFELHQQPRYIDLADRMFRRS